MSAQATRLAAVYAALARGEEPPEAVALSAREAADEADRLLAENSDLPSISGKR